MNDIQKNRGKAEWTTAEIAELGPGLKDFVRGSVRIVPAPPSKAEAPKVRSKALRKCEVCGDEFRSAHRDARFCSQRCKKRSWRASRVPETGENEHFL